MMFLLCVSFTVSSTKKSSDRGNRDSSWKWLIYLNVKTPDNKSDQYRMQDSTSQDKRAHSSQYRIDVIATFNVIKKFTIG